MRSRLLACALLVALAAAPRVARAQRTTGFADDRFEPAGAGSVWMAAESLDFQGHLRPALALIDDWAVKPMVAYDASGAEVAPLISQQVVAHLDIALLLWSRLRLDVSLPVALAQAGNSEVVNGQSYAAPDGGALGDLRLGGDVRVWTGDGARFGHVTAAIGLQLFVPTGRTQAFSSDGGVRVWPRAMAAGQRGRFAWAARAGVQLRPTDHCGCTLAPGSELNGALAAGWRAVPRLLIGPELFASTAVGGGPFAGRAATPVELLLGAHVAVAARWTASLGVARGLTDGAGAPAFRAVVGVQYGAPPPSATPALPAAPPAWTSDPDPPPPPPAPPAHDGPST